MNSITVAMSGSQRAATPAIEDEYSLIDQPVGKLIDQAIVSLSNARLLQGQLGHHLVRAAMVITFAIFGYQKWFNFEVHQIEPLIAHSPLVFWLIPAFGLRGAGFFLGTTEWLFGSLILLGFWNRKLGALGALGSIVTFLGTVTIIPFLPHAWAAEAGGFPLMYLPVAFLVKDVLFLAVSIYLAQHDVKAAAREIQKSAR